MKIKIFTLIVLLAFCIGIAALTSDLQIEAGINSPFNLEKFMEAFFNTSVAFGKPIKGGPGSDD